jgi:hypothetical protein
MSTPILRDKSCTVIVRSGFEEGIYWGGGTVTQPLLRVGRWTCDSVGSEFLGLKRGGSGRFKVLDRLTLLNSLFHKCLQAIKRGNLALG